MAIQLPLSTDKLSSPSHSLSHRVFANDDAAPEQSVVVDSLGDITIPGNLTVSSVITGVVPYTGATGDVNLGANGLTLNDITVSSLTNPYIPYTGTAGLLSNSGLYWDNSNERLGIRNNAPTYTLDVTGTIRGRALYYLNTNTTNVSTEGETRYDADNKSLTGFLAGVKQTIDTALFTQTANKTIANTTTETTVIGTGVGTVTLPANFFTVGKTIRYKTKGYLSGTNGDNITTKIKLGSVTAVTDTSALPATLTNVIFDLELSLTCRTVGATGTVIGEGRVLLSGGQGFATVTMLPLLMTTTATVDTTASNAFDVTFTWGAARVGNSMRTTVGMLEVIN